jgi:N,N-dimethylformamidase
LKLVGYSDRLSVAAGQRIAFMVSSELPTYRAQLVRLIHGDTNPAGPGFKALVVASDLDGEYRGKRQRLRPGSYVCIPSAPGLRLSGAFTIHMWIQPTTPSKLLQTLISSFAPDGSGFAIRLAEGRLSVQLGHDSGPRTLHDEPVTAHVWYSLAVVHDPGRGELRWSLDAVELTATRLSVNGTVSVRAEVAIRATNVLLAAEEQPGDMGELVAANFYNGRIDSPSMYARALSTAELRALGSGSSGMTLDAVGSWDFAQDIGSTRVTDISGNGHHGWTVNRPTRAVAGRSWDGSEVVWTLAPSQYAAIHFHDDDLDDAGWEVSLKWTVPRGTPSGIYALHVHTAGEEDYLPFAVRPACGASTAQVAFLMPTFSYLAYGNNHLPARKEIAALAKMMGAGAQATYPATAHDEYIVTNRLNSLYDTHTDGSGVCHASWLRPIVSMRPKYLSDVTGMRVPHQFNADLHLVDWLTEQAYKFDVIADENLHSEGHALLMPYKVLLTGTHPEYWSEQMIRACQQYLHGGGRLMYMGGNGMYWVAQLDPESGHTVEMRRTQPSSPRLFEPHPGELHLSATGQRGGTWRQRGLPSQQWLGVVMSGAGKAGQHYRRCPDSLDERVAWLFAGIDKDELIGNFKNLHTGYGAAGGEVDRVDFAAAGTPHHTLVLATSDRFPSTWFWDPADPPHIPRADLALVEYPNGGAVFSASSIAWCSCLSHNSYANNVSRITRNVLEGFLNMPVLLAGAGTHAEADTGQAAPIVGHMDSIQRV